MKKTLFTIVSLFTLSAHQSQALTLYEALNLAMESNPEIQESKSLLDSAKENVIQARGDFMPTVSATGSLGNQKQDFDSGSSFVDTQSYARTLKVTVEQPLFTGGKLLYGLRDVHNQLRSVEGQHSLNVQNILLRVVTAYMDFLREKEVMLLQESQVELLKKTLKETQIRFENGDVTKTDIKQAEARLSREVANHVNALGVFKTSETALENLLGNLPEELFWPELVKGLPATLEIAQSGVTHSHPKVVAALGGLASKKYQVNVAKAEHYPQITANASVSKNDNVSALGYGLDYNERSLTLNLSIPLFNGGKILSGVRAAFAAKMQAENIYEQARRDVEQELGDSFYNYQAAVASLDAYVEAEKASAIAMQGVEREVQLGERQVLDGLNAHQELLEAQVNVARGKHNVIVSSYRLLAAMGRLNLETLTE